MRRQYQTVIIGMRHNQRTDQTCGNSPRSSPSIVALAVLVDESNVESLTEVLSQKMGSSRLQSFSILHHRLDRIGIQSTSETLALRLHALYYWHCHIILSEVRVNLLHLLSFYLRFFTSSVSGMAFLPQELSRTKEQASTHLPAHHVRPLVAQDRQVAVRLNPVTVCIPYNGLRSRANDQFLFQFSCRIYDNPRTVMICLQTIVSNHGALLGEPFYVLSFFA